jgi:hypothetical protein
MSKALYSLKIYIFREELKLIKKEYNSISIISIFIIYLFIKFSLTIDAFSLRQDLEFLKNIYEYIIIDKEISKNIL